MLALDRCPIGIIVLVDEHKKLSGVVTDGDIRRALASGLTIGAPVHQIMNRDPITVFQGDSNHRVLRLFNEKIRQIPVINRDNQVIDILLYSDYTKKNFEDKKSVIVRCKAPMRISFVGGGTDIDAYIKSRGGAVLSTTIDKYCHATLIKRDDHKIILNSHDYNLLIEIDSIDSITFDGQLDLIKSVIKLMRPDFGFEIHLMSDAPPQSGLGGSSSAAVATAGLINYFRAEKMDDYQIAELAFQAERVELGITGGWQDQYASVFGGFNFIEFRDNDVFVHPLRLKTDLLNELLASLVLCTTGEQRPNQGIQLASVSMSEIKALDQTRDMALEMRNLLFKGELNEFGKLLNTAWILKQKFDAKTSNSHIKQLYEAGIEHGALGGKMLGAGGGGYLLMFCPPLKKCAVRNALRSNGANIIDFGFDFHGLQTWTSKSENSI